jgi:phosphoheptose isomerase
MAVKISSFIQDELAKTLGTLQNIADDETMANAVEQIAGVCVDSLRAGGKILFAGNGGSEYSGGHGDRPAWRNRDGGVYRASWR